MLDFSLLLPLGVHWSIALMTIGVLAYTAAYDARTGLVPLWPLAITAASLLASYFIIDREHALTVLVAACIFYVVIWGVNEVHFRLMKRDALGMGDAFWSAVAILAYGWKAVAWGWAAAAWLALFWMLGLRLAKRPIGHVYFVPFLFVGLMLVLMLAQA